MAPKTLILASTALLAALPMVAQAEPMDRAEAQMFRSSALSLRQAGEVALKQHGGDLAAVVFNDEDGRGVFEATVVGSDGTPWTVKIDAKSGDVLASGLTAMMTGDHPDDHPAGHEEKDGEFDDD